MKTDISYKTSNRYIGRNGPSKSIGLSIIYHDNNIILNPINSKNNIDCEIRIPLNHIKDTIKALKQAEREGEEENIKAYLCANPK